MAENEELSNEELSFEEQMDNIYNDTSFFIQSITSEYGYYGRFINSLGAFGAKLSVNRKLIEKEIDLLWIDAIENTLPALDVAIRNPSVGIMEKEEVLPVEFSSHVTEKSLRHLAQHTDLIQKIEGDMIIPSKLLNVYYDENLQTYENKFLNTLIDRLFVFVDRRYNVFRERGCFETELSLDLESPFKVYGASGTVKISLDSAMPDGTEGDNTFERLEKIHKAIVQYKGSKFVQSMENAMINPPIMRTNAIKKNKYLSQCLDLWDFIETYDKAGYTIESVSQAEAVDDTYISELYSIISMMYFMFEYNMNRRFRKNAVPLESRKAYPIKPEFVRRFEALKTERFNISDTEYKKVYNVFSGSASRRLTKEEALIRDAVNTALTRDRAMIKEFYRVKKQNAQLSEDK